MNSDEIRWRAMFDARSQQLVEAMQRQIALQDQICNLQSELTATRAALAEAQQKLTALDATVAVSVVDAEPTAAPANGATPHPAASDS